MNLAERVQEATHSGVLDYNDVELVHACAGRFVTAAHAKFTRSNARVVERTNQAREHANTLMRDQVRALATEWSTELHAAWSKELLATVFTVGDGEHVTYAAATADQHERRATMLETMATGDLHTAALHRKAVADIHAAKARTLAEVLRGR